MELGNSRSVTSNQTGLNDELDAVVLKHLKSEFKKPIAPYSQETFANLQQAVSQFLAKNPNGEVIIDSCCGVGESSFHHAKNHPDKLVIGIDKSEHRLDKQDHHHDQPLDNCILVRGDLNDLWRQIAEVDWPIAEHYILYPNPWPKSKHLGRRWHGAPVFKYIPRIGRRVIVRSNWAIYIEEFARALEIAGHSAQVNRYQSAEAMTPFERKYWASGQSSTQLVCDFNS